MKRLYLMRHGHALSLAEAGVKSDGLRPLSDKGHREAKLIAAELLRRGVRPSLILHSPLLRAVQTAEAVIEGGIKAQTEPFPALDNTRPAAEVTSALEGRAKTVDDMLAIGHQPQIGEVATLLAHEVFEIRTAGVVAIEWSPRPRLLWSLNISEP